MGEDGIVLFYYVLHPLYKFILCKLYRFSLLGCEDCFFLFFHKFLLIMQGSDLILNLFNPFCFRYFFAEFPKCDVGYNGRTNLLLSFLLLI